MRTTLAARQGEEGTEIVRFLLAARPNFVSIVKVRHTRMEETGRFVAGWFSCGCVVLLAAAVVAKM